VGDLTETVRQVRLGQMPPGNDVRATDGQDPIIVLIAIEEFGAKGEETRIRYDIVLEDEASVFVV